MTPLTMKLSLLVAIFAAISTAAPTPYRQTTSASDYDASSPPELNSGITGKRDDLDISVDNEGGIEGGWVVSDGDNNSDLIITTDSSNGGSWTVDNSDNDGTWIVEENTTGETWNVEHNTDDMTWTVEDNQNGDGNSGNAASKLGNPLRNKPFSGWEDITATEQPPFREPKFIIDLPIISPDPITGKISAPSRPTTFTPSTFDRKAPRPGGGMP